MADEMCGCLKNSYSWASVWTPIGHPAHVHPDGSSGKEGLDGARGPKAEHAKTAALKDYLSQGWKSRGW